MLVTDMFTKDELMFLGEALEAALVTDRDCVIEFPLWGAETFNEDRTAKLVADLGEYLFAEGEEAEDE